LARYRQRNYEEVRLDRIVFRGEHSTGHLSPGATWVNCQQQTPFVGHGTDEQREFPNASANRALSRADKELSQRAFRYKVYLFIRINNDKKLFLLDYS
jgi:hypothetical protein